MNNPSCPKCNEELRVGRCMYLHSVNVYYYCSSKYGCSTFTFDNDGYGYSTEARLLKAFNNEFIPEYSI